MPKNSEQYVRLFLLSEKDFKDIGCTKREMDSVKEYMKNLKEANEALDSVDNPSDEAIEAKRLAIEGLYTTFLKAADRNPNKWEYKPTSLPNWIIATGNVKTINQYLRSYGERLSVGDKVKLLKRRMLTLKADLNRANSEFKATGQQKKDQPAENKLNELQDDIKDDIKVISSGDDEAFLDGVHQNAFQKSGNGCWSVSTTMLLQSRGINNVNQFDVRNYRPSYEGKEIREKLKTDDPDRTISADEEEYFEIVEQDKGNGVMERGDAFLAFAPGSMLQGLEIAGYNDDVRRHGISREEYLKRTEETVKKHIIHAIKEEKSPVSFLNGGHYLTIVGITKDNKVKYKDSFPRYDGMGKLLHDADHVYEVPLTNLLKRVSYEKSSTIKMEWAADIKLSKDSKRLYDIPTDLLTIAEDGTVQNPTDNAYTDNMAIGYQCKDGMYIKTRNSSDSPDIGKSLDDNLMAGGVNMTQTIYLPKKLNMTILKAKAEKRSDEEEKHLKEDTKNFYKVEHGDQPKYHTLEEVDAKYRSLNGEMNARTTENGRKLFEGLGDKINEALNAPAPKEAKGNREFDNYIRGLCKNNKDSLTSVYKVKNTLALAFAACKMKKDGEKFDKKKITDLSRKITNYCRLNFMEAKDIDALKKIITQQDPVTAIKKVEDIFVSDVYAVEKPFQQAYLKEMKLLAENMLTKEDRSTLYANFYDAVHEAANLDPNDPKLGEKIAKANRKIIETTKHYTSGKEKVRFHTDGQDRFNNSMDALSIVGAYAPNSYITDVTKMVSNINNIRGAKKAKDPDRIDMRMFGGERAKRRNEEIKKENTKNKDSKSKNIEMKMGK